MEIKILKNILQVNDTIALENRKIFDENKIKVFNLMSSPGAGKTTLLEQTLEKFVSKIPFGIIEGDICTSFDAQRLKKFKIPVLQINTEKIGGDCHLDANMIKNALPSLNFKKIKVLFIENVGNLVCPAEFNIGEDKRIMISSVTEGDDKPLKYPLMFRTSALLLINKIDLLPYCDFDLNKFKKDVKNINPKINIIEISLKTKSGLKNWFKWLEENIK